MSYLELSPVVVDNFDWLPLALPESEGIFIKVLRVDAASGRAVLKIKMAPDSAAPKHYHFCRAVAYTISGSWDYDEGGFQAGDVAVEPIGNFHQATSTNGTEMMLVFDTHFEDGRLLDNYMSDGSVVRIGIQLLQQLEAKNLADMVDFNPMPYIQIFANVATAEAQR